MAPTAVTIKPMRIFKIIAKPITSASGKPAHMITKPMVLKNIHPLPGVVQPTVRYSIRRMNVLAKISPEKKIMFAMKKII